MYYNSTLFFLVNPSKALVLCFQSRQWPWSQNTTRTTPDRSCLYIHPPGSIHRRLTLILTYELDKKETYLRATFTFPCVHDSKSQLSP